MLVIVQRDFSFLKERGREVKKRKERCKVRKEGRKKRGLREDIDEERRILEKLEVEIKKEVMIGRR